MKHGFMAMILKSRISLRSGSMHRRYDDKKKKHNKVKAVRNQCSFFYFDYENLVHHEYAPKGRIINEEYYFQSYEKIT